MKPQPMVVLADVPAGARWFESVLGLTAAHGGSEYEMLMSGGELVAQLHEWDAHEHPAMGDPSDPSRGNGILLWFSTDDFDSLMARVTEHAATIVDGPLTNPSSQLREVWLCGPEGYVVVVAGP